MGSILFHAILFHGMTWNVMQCTQNVYKNRAEIDIKMTWIFILILQKT